VTTSAAVLRVDVPRDAPASIVRGASAGPPRTVFLPGMCSNAGAYLAGFSEAAHAHGGVLAIDGDRPCPGVPGFHTFSWDAGRQHERIEAALAAADADATPAGEITLIGYSQGASIAEQLAERWPARYTRIVLIGSPRDVTASRLRTSRALATMSCSRDVPGRMRAGAEHVAALGVPATYFEMPGCTHGNLADGNRVFDELFVWLGAHG
jgi:pimeloyl-ACP methyl ester carboxylesterase